MKYVQDILWYKDNYLSYDFIRKESSHYSFYLKKDSLAEKDFKNIINKKENQYSKIVDWLNVNNNRKIDYYLYPSIKEKLALMGDNSPGNVIWKELKNSIPKSFEIHVIYNEKCKFINEHEDTHLLSLPWGLSIYLFCEGLAQYMENKLMGKELHIVSKKLLKEKKLYPIEFLFDNKNWNTVDPIIIYPQAGSFSKYIIEKYGKERFEELYKNTSRKNTVSENLLEIKKFYKKHIKELEEEWLEAL
ncbi:MAG TPA: hypothetical protein PKU93_03010 [Candidatus Pacearchaeota archaeon]|nr:hypothetical protein [Candidatus Pacearchaeota archaeon]